MWSCKAAAFECKSGTSTVSRACFVRHAVDGPNEINANLQHLQCNRAPQCLRHPHFAERFCCSLDNSRAHVLGEVSGRYTCLARHRRHQMKTRSAPLCRFLDTWRKALVAWLSNGMDNAVLSLCLNDNMAKTLAAPALLFKSSPHKRKYVQVSPESKWAVVEQAKKSRTSVETIVNVRSNTSNTTDADITLGQENK